MTKEYRPRLTQEEYDLILSYRAKVTRNVLVIGDLHAPFIKDGYLDFCKRMYEQHNCTEVVLIGDILDNHFSSYHETNADGFGGAEELERAKVQIQEFYEAFPFAKVCIGNHDRLPNRKAFTGGLSSRWVKAIGEVLETPNWDYAEQHIIDNVLYWHGDGMNIRRKGNTEAISIVQGHLHSQSFYEAYCGSTSMRFVLQIGCGVDKSAYAFAYAKNFPKPQINVGIVKDNGRWALIEHMDL